MWLTGFLLFPKNQIGSGIGQLGATRGNSLKSLWNQSFLRACSRAESEWSPDCLR
jgi:hypothetical protein